MFWLESGSWRCRLFKGDGSAACRWMGAHWVRASQPESQNSAEVRWTADECKTEWQMLSFWDCLSHPGLPAFIVFWYLSWWPVTSSCWSNATEGANPPTLIFLWSASDCSVFSNSKEKFKACCLPNLSCRTPDGNWHSWLQCKSSSPALPSQPQREPDAGKMLLWGSQRAWAAAAGVPDLWTICFVARLLCGGGDVSRFFSLQAESKERFCISMCVCGISSVREILLGLSQHYRNTHHLLSEKATE